MSFVDLLYRWRINESKERIEKKQDNEIYVTDLIYCPLKYRYQKMYKELSIVASVSPTTIMGELIHIGMEKLVSDLLKGKNIMSEVEVERKINIDGKEYVIKGRVDLIVDNNIIEIKSSRSDANIPHEHHILQLRIYLWLTGCERGLLLYITSNRIAEYEIIEPLSDGEISDLVRSIISGEPAPRYQWECSYCSYALICPKKRT